MTAEIIEGDCLAVLPTLADASVDAVICDPPYELKFMSRKWDGTGVAVRAETWAEVLRVLKPGGHLLAFGGSRTHHRMTCAIEDAGFEIRDSIHWVYGSGFPKSLDISKAIDKAAGAKREVVGRRTDRAATPLMDIRGGKYMSGNGAIDCSAITAPATPDAERWSGWGTALKPAHEPIVVARKLISEDTVAANVLKHGTGGLNVDACRVSHSEPCKTTKRKITSGQNSRLTNDGRNMDQWERSHDGTGLELLASANPSGRWPPNLVLTHHPDCERIGVKRVKGTKPPSGISRKETSGYRGGWGDREAFGYAASDGTEAVEEWQCVDGCPIAEMDQQSSKRPGSTAGTREVRRVASLHDTAGGWRMRHGEYAGHVYGDSGGASRFFPTFAFEADDFAPFLYCAKASRSERNEGLEGMPEGPPPASARNKPADGRQLALGQPRANHHPTVKPLTLMRWLCRLVTPPGGLVLDPFAGSGSTGVAALQEGYRFIGIEQILEYCAIARRRLDQAEASKSRLAAA